MGLDAWQAWSARGRSAEGRGGSHSRVRLSGREWAPSQPPLPLPLELPSPPSPPSSFDNFYVYVCTALLLKFSPQLKGFKFQDLVQFLQKLPTREWRVQDVEELLSQAFVWKTLFEAAPSHLLNS